MKEIHEFNDKIREEDLEKDLRVVGITGVEDIL